MDKKKRVRALLVASMHLFKDSEGHYYSPAIYNDEFFGRYLNVFDEISLVAKVRCVADSDKQNYIKLDTTHIKVYELSWYQGMKQMASKLIPLLKVYRRAVKDCDCYIFRVLQIESMFAYLLRNRKLPYVVEVVNDPADWQEFGSVFRKGLGFFLKRMIQHADGASYVTQYVLQEKYPRKEKKNSPFFTSYYSSVELLKEDIREPKKYPAIMQELNLVHVANTINGNGKGHKIVLKVVKILTEKGIAARVRFIGDGPSVEEFKTMAKELGIEEQTSFVGRISNHKALLEEIRNSDIFLFPTYSEGLPRCVIEACAVGTPCLSTPVAGIPELLDKEFLFEPEDVDGFVGKIEELMADSSKLNEMSSKNVKIAMQYEKSILNERRREFYSNLLKLVE